MKFHAEDLSLVGSQNTTGCKFEFESLERKVATHHVNESDADNSNVISVDIIIQM